MLKKGIFARSSYLRLLIDSPNIVWTKSSVCTHCTGANKLLFLLFKEPLLTDNNYFANGVSPGNIRMFLVGENVSKWFQNELNSIGK